MKNLLISLALIFIYNTAFSQAGFEWAQTCGNPFYGETKTVLNTDAEGNIFMAGNFIETAVFGTESITSSGGTDIFIVKYDQAGEVSWVLQDGAEDYEYLHGLSIDEEGFYTCGTFYGATSIAENNFNSLGSKDIFIARYDKDGDILWSKQIGSPKTDYANAIESDPTRPIVGINLSGSCSCA